MQSNQFYKGMLFELEKLSSVNPANVPQDHLNGPSNSGGGFGGHGAGANFSNAPEIPISRAAAPKRSAGATSQPITPPGSQFASQAQTPWWRSQPEEFDAPQRTDTNQYRASDTTGKTHVSQLNPGSITTGAGTNYTPVVGPGGHTKIHLNEDSNGEQAQGASLKEEVSGAPKSIAHWAGGLYGDMQASARQGAMEHDPMGSVMSFLKSNGGGMLAGGGIALLLSQLMGGGGQGGGVTNNYYGGQPGQPGQAPQFTGPQSFNGSNEMG